MKSFDELLSLIEPDIRKPGSKYTIVETIQTHNSFHTKKMRSERQEVGMTEYYIILHHKN